MIKNNKNIFVVLLSIICLFAFSLFFTSVGVQTAKASSNVITLIEKAACRISQEEDGGIETSGLKFVATLDKQGFNNLYTTYDQVDAGIIIVPADFITAAGGHTFNALSAYSGLQGKTFYKITENFKENGSNYEFSNTIINIKPSNYNRDFSAVGFVKIVESDDTLISTLADYTYFDGAYYAYSNVHTACVYDIAYAAYTDRVTEETDGYFEIEEGLGVYGKLEGYQYDILKNYLDGVAVIKTEEGQPIIANNSSEYYTSPYTIEKDSKGKSILIGKDLKGLNYNDERKIDFYNITEDYNLYVPKTSLIAQIDTDRTATLTTYATGLTSTTGHAFQYIGWKGEYGVGTYLDFEFSGNNMPQVMFFADSIDGYMCAGKSGTDTSGMRKGVIVMSGTSSERLNRMYVIGPNRVRTDQTAGDKTTTYAFSDGAPLHAKLTLYGETTTSYTGTTYPLLTQKGLTEAGEDKSYKYTIGTYEAENGKLGIHIILTYADGTTIYNIKEATTLNVSDLTAGNIVVYPPIKGNGTSTFKFSAPYSLDLKYSSAATFAEDGSVTLKTFTSGLLSTTTHAFQYIGWKGEYGVGTYLDFEFSGNNMPQVMFFADSIDGYMCAGKSGTDTSGMRKGVIVMSGTSSERLNRMYVIGPNRVRTDQTAGDKTTTYAFSDGAPLHAKLTLYGETTNSYTGTTYPLLTQKGLTEAGEDKSYKYTIGTYEAENGKLGIHIILTYADGEAIYDIRKATTLNVSDLTAGNIVVYPPIKGNGTSTFRFSIPYVK